MDSIRLQLKSFGYANLGITDITVPTQELAAILAKSIDSVVSAPVEQISTSQIGAKGLNTYGGNYGYEELPLHTDLAHWHRPPRYVLLRCISGSPVVSTRVLHHRDLSDRISPVLMRRALFSPRRRLDGKMYLLHMQTTELFRWDNLFLTPKNSSARQVAELMCALRPELPTSEIFLTQPGSTLLIDNWQVLHGRSAVPPTEVGRSLHRVYMDPHTNGN